MSRFRLSNDIVNVPPRQILDTRPTLTMVGGRIVYEARD
jgi:predicted amidohydrolase YtcJ